MTPTGRDAWERLTNRERQVATMACEYAESQRYLAARLDISVCAINQHLQNVYTKIGMGSRIELVVFGYSHGWVQPLPGAADDPA